MEVAQPQLQPHDVVVNISSSNLVMSDDPTLFESDISHYELPLDDILPFDEMTLADDFHYPEKTHSPRKWIDKLKLVFSTLFSPQIQVDI
jgi:hypothetical protein